jgi:hypothetical protein
VKGVESREWAMVQYGVCMPDCKWSSANLDQENRNNKWIEATRSEIAILDEFEAFRTAGSLQTNRQMS